MRRFTTHHKRKVRSLDGIWDFSWLGVADPANVDPGKITFGEHMAVPGCFDANALYGGKHGLAAYQKTLHLVPNKTYRLVFDSVLHWGQFFIDGKSLGEHAGGYTIFSLDFKAGRANAVLTVLVDNRFDAKRSPLHRPHFDWYHFGGLGRGVELHELSDVSIDGLFTKTTSISGPELEVRIPITNHSGKKEGNFKIIFDGKELVNEKVTIPASKSEIIRILKVSGSSLWSPEKPNLHELVVELEEDDFCERVGLRQVEARGQDILLNGEKIILRGVNRHESHPQFGAALPPAIIASDMLQLRDLGVDFVRGSHYPQDHLFLDLCDENGILVWCEGTGWQYDEEMRETGFAEAQEKHLEEMIVSLCNHPSIIFWGMLNESFGNRDFAPAVYERCVKKIRSLDDSRLVTYATCKPKDDLTLHLFDVISVNTYPGWYDGTFEEIPAKLKKLADLIDQRGFADKPFIISEIGADGIYGWRDWNASRTTETYQAKLLDSAIRTILKKDSRFAGIAIWQFCDIRTSEMNEISKGRGYNNKGLVDEYRRPKLAYETVKGLFTGGKESKTF